jgi:hypothetical protein
MDIYGAAAAPVDAGLARQETLVDQVAAEGGVVVAQGLQDVVDRGFGIAMARLERLRDAVEQQTALGRAGRHRGDPAVADERTELILTGQQPGRDGRPGGARGRGGSGRAGPARPVS